MPKLTKKEVISQCREVFRSPSWGFDKTDRDAKAQYWNDYTDMLCKDRQITNHQYDTWSNPF
jgi:hypothetical protein